MEQTKHTEVFSSDSARIVLWCRQCCKESEFRQLASVRVSEVFSAVALKRSVRDSIAQCHACFSTVFVRYENYTSIAEPIEETEVKRTVYPYSGQSHQLMERYNDLPLGVRSVYEMTAAALGAGMLSIAANGLRRIVELIGEPGAATEDGCNDVVAQLVSKQVMTRIGADMLRETLASDPDTMTDGDHELGNRLSKSLRVLEIGMSGCYFDR